MERSRDDPFGVQEWRSNERWLVRADKCEARRGLECHDGKILRSRKLEEAEFRREPQQRDEIPHRFNGFGLREMRLVRERREC